MSSRLNVTFFVALALQMLMIGATAAPLADGLNPMGDYTKMDKALRDSLSSSSEDDIVPVIFQLKSEVLDDDKFNHYIICQIDSLLELFNIPIEDVDEDWEYWENGDCIDLNNMFIKSISKMMIDYNNRQKQN